MNLLLLDRQELDPDNLTRLSDRRAHHLRKVLRVQPGDPLKAGILNGPLGTAEVLAVDDQEVRLRCSFEGEAPAISQDSLVLAIPRPKILLRCLELATALGFGRILLTRTWRVDKSYLASRALDPNLQHQHLIFGLEQSCRTRLPQVQTFELFKPFVEDHLDELVPMTHRLVAHPNAAKALGDVPFGQQPFTLAVGPEGGFIPYEISMLEKSGFTAVSAGPHPLRVEAALAWLSGQANALRNAARQR